jgi:hypothetical protein
MVRLKGDPSDGAGGGSGWRHVNEGTGATGSYVCCELGRTHE